MRIEEERNIAKAKNLKNDYTIIGEAVYIHLSNKFGQQMDTIIDIEYLEKALKHHWNIRYEKDNNQYYATTCVRYRNAEGRMKGTTVHLHRYLLDITDSKIIIDHIDGTKTLDNRKQNLRVTNNLNNSANRKGANSNNKTGVRNVNYIKSQNIYKVQIMRNGERFSKDFSIDQFEEACKYAEEKRKEIFGEFAGCG